MHFRIHKALAATLLVSTIFAFSPVTQSNAQGQSIERQKERMTPLVKAVQECRLSVVNLRGKKTIVDESSATKTKQVNGMGTGVVIDKRGYILTNYHVVQGVKTIEVTTGDRQKTTARLLAHDPETDLAVLKIDVGKPLPVIAVGTSSDLMLAETVTAVGNAYGYEHTVTVGIISQLGRTVQVNDEQIYRNLIQTDAAINPGNSGGPLMNAYGEMIGINVAVRIGAQGIAFAIPVNDAMKVAAKLIKKLVAEDVYHGIKTRTIYVDNQPQLVVASVEPKSPAETAGIHKGDRIIEVNQSPSSHDMHFHSAFVGDEFKRGVELTLNSRGIKRNVRLKTKQVDSPVSSVAWEDIGIKVIDVDPSEMKGMHKNYTRGLRVTGVRPASPAEDEGILAGDIIVAMHGWKTETTENLAFVLSEDLVRSRGDFMFYILRDKEPFWGQMRIAERDTLTR